MRTSSVALWPSRPDHRGWARWNAGRREKAEVEALAPGQVDEILEHELVALFDADVLDAAKAREQQERERLSTMVENLADEA